MATPNPPLNPHLFLRPRPPCYSRLQCDLQAFKLPEFRDPLALSLVALVVGVVIVLGWRAVRDARGRRRFDSIELARPLPIAGLLVAVVALEAYERTGHLVPGLAAAIVLLAAGGLLADVARLPLLVRMVLALPGAVVLAEHSALPDPRWVLVFAGTVTVVGSGLIADLDVRATDLGLGPVLLAVTVVGLYECEPDPDFALLLVGAALPLALLAWPLVLARLGGAGAAAMSGFMAWAAAVGGRGMLSAVVSGAACLGLFLVVPLARLIAFRRTSVLERLRRRWWTPLLVGAVQLAFEVGCSRIAPGRTPQEAAEIAGAGLVVAVVVACLLSGRRAGTTADERAEQGHDASPSALPASQAAGG